MIAWDIIFFPFTFLLAVLKIFFSLSVTIGGIMVSMLAWIYHYSSYLLILFWAVYWLLTWIAAIMWYLTCTVISASSVIGEFLVTNMKLLVQYVYYGLSYLPNGVYSIIVLSYNIVMSMTINVWLLMKDGIWPAIMQCIVFIISMVVYMMNVLYEMLTVLYGYIVHISTSSVVFIQHTAGPFVATVFFYMLHGLVDVLEYCYSVLMTILHYITEVMLRVINTLPGTVQPLASDVMYYGSDVVAMAISAVFNVLTWMTTTMIEVTALLVTTPIFWALLLLAVIVYHCYSKWWHTARVTVAPVERREVRQERNDGLQSATGQLQSVGRDEVDVSEKEKFEEQMLCVVCQGERKSVLLQPCNHLCLCVNCVKPVLEHNRICPMCRKYVRQWTKVYL